MKFRKTALIVIVTLCFCLGACTQPEGDAGGKENTKSTSSTIPDSHKEISVAGEKIPGYSGEPYAVVNDNVPDFKEKEEKKSFEEYSKLDTYGRCGTAFANVGKDLMPKGDRSSIGKIKPSGWHTVKYDFVDGKYLYNRCHLIGYQLSGENANQRNLITGTRYMNVDGMLPFENMVADYVKETNHHVLYRVTPVYEGKSLLAEGVQMEAWSVEDGGKGICFNVFVYNVQPGVRIDYATGESILESKEMTAVETEVPEQSEGSYILNTSSHKFHFPTCSGVQTMKAENTETYDGNRESLMSQGYEPCGKCRP